MIKSMTGFGRTAIEVTGKSITIEIRTLNSLLSTLREKFLFEIDSLFKIEADDGDGVYYLEATNEFVILSTDGYIRTYFLPSSGRAYFDRQ